MLSKTQNKYIRSLTQQKYRKEHNVFIAEGDKIAKEWLNSGYKIQLIVALEEWLQENSAFVASHPEATVLDVKDWELEAVSTLQTSNQVLLVVSMPKKCDMSNSSGWSIALDGIQDPGNMGTIIRIADWFGIQHIVCSPDCVDVYNPKVVQSAMGGHLRVQIQEMNLQEFISKAKLPIFAATLGGTDVYTLPKRSSGILVIGNESIGVSQAIIQKATYKVTIPRRGGAESLNAAVSTGILCAMLLPC
ncbi:MAG: RNA methyltransferase [Bacteroidota bacterium]